MGGSAVARRAAAPARAVLVEDRREGKEHREFERNVDIMLVRDCHRLRMYRSGNSEFLASKSIRLEF